MNHLKLYEEHNIDKPERVDFVIIDDTNFDQLKPIIKSTVGRISRIDNNDRNNPYYIYVDYPNIDEVGCEPDEILYLSKNKEELEAILAAKKYNL